MQQITQYDLGIIPFNLEKGNKQFLDTTIANKLFEYLAAGLPVLTSSLTSYNDFFKENPVGQTFENIDDILIKIPQLLENSNTIDFTNYIFTYESQVHLLEELYTNVLRQKQTPSKTNDNALTNKNVDQINEKLEMVPDKCVSV